MIFWFTCRITHASSWVRLAYTVIKYSNLKKRSNAYCQKMVVSLVDDDAFMIKGNKNMFKFDPATQNRTDD